MKIAIIGAGVAGLTLARELEKLGGLVNVFEKSRGLGGRLATRRTSWAHLDMGAQYFTARSTSFLQEVHQWKQAGVIARWDMMPYRSKGGALEPSPDDQARYVGVPDMNSISHFLGRSLMVHRGTRIIDLQRSGRQWTLHGEDGNCFSGYDWVVSTLPAEQVTDLLGGLSDLGLRLPGTVHGPCWAVGLATRGQVSQDVQGIFGDEIVSWVSRLSSRPNRFPVQGFHDSWMVHFTPQWSLENPAMPENVVEATALDWLSSLLRVDLERVNGLSHYWRYASMIDPEAEPSEAFHLNDSQQIAIIGAWCHGGRVEGAYLSALALLEHSFK